MQNCLLSLVEVLLSSCYHDVKNNSKGGINMTISEIKDVLDAAGCCYEIIERVEKRI